LHVIGSGIFSSGIVINSIDSTATLNINNNIDNANTINIGSASSEINVGYWTFDGDSLANTAGSISSQSITCQGGYLKAGNVNCGPIGPDIEYPLVATADGLFGTAAFFDSSGNMKIFIDNSCNVGIGTDTPTSQLHVIGTGNFTQALRLNGSGVGLYDTSVFNLGTISGTNAINCGQDRQIQNLTLNGVATTFTTGTGWPTSNSVSRETTLNIFASGNTSVTWTIVNDWYRQPDSPLPSGRHIVLLRSVGSGTMQGHYIGNKTN